MYIHQKGYAPRTLLKHMMIEAGVEYRLLLLSIGNKVPPPNLIEIISYKSDNPWFRTEVFRRMLINYRDYGYDTLIRWDNEEKLARIRKRNREKRREEKMNRKKRRGNKNVLNEC